MRGRLFIAALRLTLAAASTSWAQSVRGGIEGHAKDEQGQPVPGATVTLTSPALQGERSTTTDEEGYYRFNLLPAGTYTARYTLAGYQTVEQPGIVVAIGAQVQVNPTLRLGVAEEVTVTAEAPVVDVSSTQVGVSVTEEFFEALPTGRNYASIAQVTPGVQTDGAGTTVYGSTGSENAYYIDGLNTTGIELGTQGKNLNFDFIQEVQVITAGYSAEYGRSTGGTLNVITKSGGNDFSGNAFGYHFSDKLQNDLSDDAALGAVSGSTETASFSQSDVGAGVGGPIAKDRLWFFGTYNYLFNKDNLESLEDFSAVVPLGPTLGQEFEAEETAHLASGKLTFRAADNHNFAASIIGDPQKTSGVLASLAGAPSSFLGEESTGGFGGSINYDGVLSEDLVVAARLAQHNEKYELSGDGSELAPFVDLTDPLGDGTITNGWVNDLTGEVRVPGFNFYQDQDFRRDQISASATYFLNGLGGDHEFKIGGEFEDIKVVNENRQGGGIGDRVYRLNCGSRCPEGYQYYYRHRIFIKERKDPADLTAADIQNPLAIDTKSDSFAMFLQDRWEISDMLTVNAGIRWDVQRLFNADGEEHAKIDDAIAPRLGFTFDPTREGKAKIFGNWGLFYETIPMDIVIRSFGGEISVFSYNLSDEPGDVACTGEVNRGCSVLGGEFSLVDPDLKGQRVQEFVLGAEYEVVKNLSVGAKVIRRELDQVIEDALAEVAPGELNYIIGNPGQGIQEIAIDYHYNLHEQVQPERLFQGLEFTVNKRFSNNFQFLASALFSKLEGNYDGTFQVSTGQLDPNLNSAFDYFDFMVNNNGKLSNDRPVQLKLDGSYKFDFGLDVGLSTFFRSGVPITAMGYSTAYQNWEYYLSERGEFGRTDSEFEADVHLGYGFEFANDMRLSFVMDVFNVLNRQGETSRSMRYTFTSEDYVPIDPDGTILPPITEEESTSSDPDARIPTNSAWNTSNAWQSPRSIRLGARFSF